MRSQSGAYNTALHKVAYKEQQFPQKDVYVCNNLILYLIFKLLLLSNDTMDSVWSQQGTVDWGHLAHSSMTISVEVLSRYTKAGVEPLTVAMGHGICSKFCIPADAQQRVSQSVKKLKAVSSYGNLLWFGFGVKHIVRVLVESEQGIGCVGLCGCLSVSFDQMCAAQVLRQLAQGWGIPGVLMPSINQWCSLINVCSGSLLGSDFPKLVEGFSRLWCEMPEFGRLGMREKPSSAEELVERLTNAIEEISKVSDRSLESVTIVGNSVCAWIAAVAEWLFSLNVQVIDDQGACLYRKSDSKTHPAEVIIVRSFNNLAVLERTSSFPIGESVLGFGQGESHVLTYGQSSWGTILNDTFGSSFSHFCNVGEVGEYLILQFELLDDRFHFRFGGPRAVLFAIERLPELGALQPLIRQADRLKADPSGAVRSPKAGSLNPCRCIQCTPVDSENGATIDTRKHPSPCHRAVADTIVKYTEVLMRLKLDKSIRPSSTGLSLLYREVICRQAHTGSPSPTSEVEDDGLFQYLKIMTGFVEQSRLPNQRVSAISRVGITVFYTSLKYPDHSPGNQIIIQMMPGGIEHNDTTYSEIYDLDTNSASLDNMPIQSISGDNYQDFNISSKSYTLELKLKETLDVKSLFAGFVWKLRQTTKDPKYIKAFGSAELSQALLYSVQNPTCHKFDMTIQYQEKVLTGRCEELSASIFQELDINWNTVSLPSNWAMLDHCIYKKHISSTKNKLVARSDTFQPAVMLTVRLLLETYSVICSDRSVDLVKLKPCILCASQLREDYIVVRINTGQNNGREKVGKVGEVSLLSCQIRE